MKLFEYLYYFFLYSLSITFIFFSTFPIMIAVIPREIERQREEFIREQKREKLKKEENEKKIMKKFNKLETQLFRNGKKNNKDQSDKEN